ncbi:MAG: hypothetical protein QXL01_02375 [Thermoplasmatales archaeon]
MAEYFEIFEKNSPVAYRLNKYSNQQEILEHGREIVFDCIVFGLTPLSARLAYALGFANLRVLVCFNEIVETVPEIRQETNFLSLFLRKTAFAELVQPLYEYQSRILSDSIVNTDSIFVERPGYTLDLFLSAMNEGVNLLRVERVVSLKTHNTIVNVSVEVSGRFQPLYCRLFVSAQPSTVADGSFFNSIPYKHIDYMDGLGVVEGADYFLVQDQFSATVYSQKLNSDLRALFFPKKKGITRIDQHVILNADNIDTVCRVVFNVPYVEPSSVLLGSRELIMNQTDNGLELMKLLNSCGLYLP